MALKNVSTQTEARRGRNTFRLYSFIWLAFLLYPLFALFTGPSRLQIILGLAVLAATVAAYVYVFQPARPPDDQIHAMGYLVAFFGIISCLLINASFIGLFVYSIIIFARLRSLPALLAASFITLAAMISVGLHVHIAVDALLGTAFSAAASSFGLRGVLRIVDYAVALRDAQQQIEQLAKAEERARIARDMHDLLGHTLSVIVLKSELAQQLLARSGQEGLAGREIAEVHDVARAALREVREVVTGYRRADLTSELRHAQTALLAAGIRCSIGREDHELSEERESALALALREAVTNVVRHSCARTCEIQIAELHGQIVLKVKDDGNAREQVVPGNGLQGMGERLRMLGGSLCWACTNGMYLEAAVPSDR